MRSYKVSSTCFQFSRTPAKKKGFATELTNILNTDDFLELLTESLFSEPSQKSLSLSLSLAHHFLPSSPPLILFLSFFHPKARERERERESGLRCSFLALLSFTPSLGFSSAAFTVNSENLSFLFADVNAVVYLSVFSLCPKAVEVIELCLILLHLSCGSCRKTKFIFVTHSTLWLLNTSTTLSSTVLHNTYIHLSPSPTVKSLYSTNQSRTFTYPHNPPHPLFTSPYHIIRTIRISSIKTPPSHPLTHPI